MGWMIVTFVAGIISLSHLVVPGRYWGQNGLRDAIFMSIIFAAPGYLLYRWGSRGKKA